MATTRWTRVASPVDVAGRQVNRVGSGSVVVTGSVGTVASRSAQSIATSIPPSKSPGARQSSDSGSGLYAFRLITTSLLEVPTPGKSTTRPGKTIRYTVQGSTGSAVEEMATW